MTMRFAHSFWAKPFPYRCYLPDTHNIGVINKIYFLLSAEFVKRHGYKIDLYTSTDSLPYIDASVYDNVYTVLDNNKRLKDIDLKFWAVSKIIAYESPQWTDSTVHIDGDVFLFKDEVYKILENSKECDLVVQGKEIDKYYNNITLPTKNRLKKYLQGVVPDSLWSNVETHNAGLVMIRNDKLRQKYVNTYFKLVNHICSQKEFALEQFLVPDLLTEQEILLILSKSLKVKSLVADYGETQPLRTYPDIGYIHSMGGEKYTKKEVLKGLDWLEKLNPDKANQMLTLLNNIKVKQEDN